MRVSSLFNSCPRTDQPTDQLTDRGTDKASYRVACPQLKRERKRKTDEETNRYETRTDKERQMTEKRTVKDKRKRVQREEGLLRLNISFTYFDILVSLI